MSDDKLELREVLALIDTRSGSVWDELSEEQKKFVKRDLFILNRYVSSVKSQEYALQKRFILSVNQYYNKHWNALQSHPELLWRLLCICSPTTEEIYDHEWIGFKKKEKKNPAVKFLSEIYPTMKLEDIENIARIVSLEDIKELARHHGYDNKQIKVMFK